MGVEWIWARDLSRDPSHSQLFDGIDPSDLRQGSLGDCWLMAAIAAVAEFPRRIEGIFPGWMDPLPTDGRHEVILFDVAKAAWVRVCVDEFVPCRPRRWFELHATPIFAQPEGNEMWVLLLEKAFAKTWGGYHKLKGGHPTIAWQALTGCTKQLVISKVGPDYWEEYELDVEEQKRMMRKGRLDALPLAREEGAPTYNDRSLWRHIKDCDERNTIMAARIDGSTRANEHRSDGLVTDHAYSVIQAKEVGAFRLLNLRNPFGGGIEWNGRWSDNDKAWTEHPEVAITLKFQAADDGAFWISAEDFFRIFDGFNLCPETMDFASGSAAREWSRGARAFEGATAGRCSSRCVLQ